MVSLPYPYHMGVYSQIKLQRCVRYCIKEFATKRGRVSSLIPMSSSLKLTHETTEESVSKIAKNEKNYCEKSCVRNRDVYFKKKVVIFTETYSDGPYDDTTDRKELGTIGYWFRTSDYLVLNMIFVPELRFVDLIIYSGSIFSIWFGLCSLELVNWILKLKTENLLTLSPELAKYKLDKIKYLVYCKFIMSKFKK